MFPLIPYKHFVINTKLSNEEARRLVEKNIAPSRSIFQARIPGKEFEGSTGSDGFTINRIISYRNSFLPVLNGRFKPNKLGTKIDVYVTLHPIILVFFPIFFYPFFEMIVMAIKDSIVSGHFNPSRFDSLGMFSGVLYFIGQIAFGFETNKAEKFIRMIYKKQ